MLNAANYRLQAARDLCETLLMPGGKARLSPYLADLIPAEKRFLVPIYQSVIVDLFRSGYMPANLTLLDYNSPDGIGQLAIGDALLAWYTACALYDVPPGLERIIGYIRDNEHGHLIQNWLARLSQRAQQVQELRFFHQAQTWWKPVSQATSLPSLVFVAFPWQLPKLRGLLDRLPPDAIVAAITWHNADAHPSQLFAWRYTLLRERDDFVALGPCGQEYGRALPEACQTCTHGRQALLHNVAQSDTGEVVDSPPWSYVLLLKRADVVEQVAHPLLTTTALAQAEAPELYARYLGTIYEKEVVRKHPDADPAKDNPADTKWHDYLRLCPGHTDVTRLAIEGNAGIAVPRLRYGQWLHLQGVRASKPYAQAPEIGVLRLSNEASLQQFPGLPITETFLSAYTPAIRAAVDEVAYRWFGFAQLRPFQHTVLERVLCGGDIFAIAATGGGKSECYILPALLLPGITIIVSPLKSLMQDQYEQRLRDRYGVDYLATTLNGDVNFYERQGRLRRMVLGHYKLVYVTPEQLERGYVLDALRQAAQTVGVRYLALDEAHCISQWGHDFRPSYLNIVERLGDYALHPRRIALTATASPLVRDDVCQELRLDKRDLRAGGDVYIDTSNRPELNLVVQRVRTTEEKAQIILNALRQLQEGSAIVFMPHTGGNPDEPRDFGPPQSAPHPGNAGMVSTGVSPFARYLGKYLDKKVAVYHGAMDDKADPANTVSSNDEDEEIGAAYTRQEEQRAFMRSEKRIMVATKGFGMGIDKPDIRLVIHRSPTANLEAYAQEAGRAGRDGKLATVMLLFSEDQPKITQTSPDAFLPRTILQSDREIQEFFTEQRYVRRVDVEAVVAFLCSDEPKPINGTLYFTNDQVMKALDNCQQRPDFLGLTQPYQWPKFEPRSVRSYESPEHKHIRNTGHLYREKRSYIGRILKVLYNNRPTLNGQVIPLIRSAHESGLVLRNFSLYLPEKIVASPAYFGERLRRAGITPQELRSLLPNGDRIEITPLAERLALSLRETASMLSDIRSCEGRTGQYGQWIGTLLNFRSLEAPRWVDLPDPYDTVAWRNYAGAYSRAKASSSKTLDDYFPERVLNKPVGWEVLPGSGLTYPDRNAYLEAFMTLHDERQENDQRNFAYLIDRYIGADGHAQTCLRSLLLGYLKTGETIAGGNCFGCSVCVPDLRFDHYPVPQRQRVVVRLMVETLDLLETIESHNRQSPPRTSMMALLAAIKEENAQGRAGDAYLDSWLARVIQDDPEHQGALWVRLWAWEQHVLTLSPTDVVTALTRLTAVTQSSELVDELRKITEHCLTAPDYATRRPMLLDLGAQLAVKRQVWHEAAMFWEQLLENSMPQKHSNKELLLRLLDLYQRKDRLNDITRATAIAERLLYLPALSLTEAQVVYKVLLHKWEWSDVEAILASQHAMHNEVALLAWLEQGKPGAHHKVIEWLAQSPETIRLWPAVIVREIAQRLQPELGHSVPALLTLSETLLTSKEDAPLVCEFLLQVWSNDGELTDRHYKYLAANLLQLDITATRECLKARPNAANLLQALWQARGKSDFPLKWFTYFPESAIQQLSDEVFMAVWAAFMASKRSVSEALLDALITRLGTTPNAGVSLLTQVTNGNPNLGLQFIQSVLRIDIVTKSAMLKALFPSLLHADADQSQVHRYLDAMSTNQELYQDEALIAACLDVWSALQADHALWQALLAYRVESDTLVNAAKKWLAYTDKPHRLDMLVIILQDVCDRSTSTWMTPVSLKFQALCAAGRFVEAEAILKTNPDLRVQRESAANFLHRARTQTPIRQAMYTAELQRLWRLQTGQRNRI